VLFLFECKARKLLRRLALLIPTNRRKQILLQHRTPDAPRKPDYWAFFGGHIETRESPEAAAAREFKEELQIELEEIKFFRKYIFIEDGETVEKFFFITRLDEDSEKLKRQQLEGDDLGYFGSSDLDKLKITEGDRFVLEVLFSLNW